MSWEHAAEARAALNAIVTDPEHGIAALSSAQTMSNLLKDLLPDAPREKSILVAAAEAGLANTLRQHVDQGMDPNTAIRLTASSFSATTPFTPEACSWVTGEIATALGMSHGGAGGGTPAGFDPQQGMPTQIAPIPGAGGYAPGQAPTQGLGQTPGQGGGLGAGGQPTTPRPWQAGGGAFGGQPGGGQPGGFGQAQPVGGQPAGGWQPGTAFGGQPVAGQPGGWQPGGFQGPPGGVQPGGGFGPTGPMGPIGPGGPVKPRSGKRGWFIGGGLAAALVVLIVVGASLAGGSPTPKATNNPSGHTTSSAPGTPPPSPSLTHPPGTDSLQTIMNPTASGASPVGTNCVTAPLFTMKESTLVARLFCANTTRANIEVWGYQFDNFSDYQAGVAQINHYVGFDTVTPGTTCPPSSGTSEGKVGWHANHNPKYKSRTGQDIECLIDHQKPVLIWTMPTQDVFFIGQNRVKGSSFDTVIKWWETLTYG